MTRPNETIPPRQLSFAGLSHQGNHREENEDAFVANAELGLFVVADGMGGRASGDVAARLAIEELEAFFQHRVMNPRDAWPFEMTKQASLGANILNVGLKVANAAIRGAAMRAPELRRMGATAVALALGQTQVCVAHVGDARAYRLRAGNLTRLTRDHSIVEEMKAAKPDMSEAALAQVATKNVVTRALGSKDDVEPTVYQNSFAVADTYLLCSDGLWGEISDEAMQNILVGTRDLEQACQLLIDSANNAGGHDNISVVLLRID